MLTRRATMWWMAFGSSGNKVSSYVWASVFLQTQQRWKVPATSQANPEWGCWVGLPRIIGAIPAPACCHWYHSCWNLQRALQADLLCRVRGEEAWMRYRGYIFTLFTKKNSLPPPKYHCKSILRQSWSLYIFFFLVSRRTPVFFYRYLHCSISLFAHLNKELLFTGILHYVGVPFVFILFWGDMPILVLQYTFILVCILI